MYIRMKAALDIRTVGIGFEGGSQVRVAAYISYGEVF